MGQPGPRKTCYLRGSDLTSSATTTRARGRESVRWRHLCMRGAVPRAGRHDRPASLGHQCRARSCAPAALRAVPRRAREPRAACDSAAVLAAVAGGGSVEVFTVWVRSSSSARSSTILIPSPGRGGLAARAAAEGARSRTRGDHTRAGLGLRDPVSLAPREARSHRASCRAYARHGVRPRLAHQPGGTNARGLSPGRHELGARSAEPRRRRDSFAPSAFDAIELDLLRLWGEERPTH